MISNGDWVFIEDKIFLFDSILKWWRNINVIIGVRFLLFLDIVYLDKWVDNIWKVEKDFIVI